MISKADDILLNLRDVSVSKHGRMILDHVSLSVVKNEILTLIGPNGSGKSTLVKTALGLLKPDTGTITKRPDLKVAYVPQKMDIETILPIKVKRFLQLHTQASLRACLIALEHTGAAALLNQSLHALSGGELRRVLLARAIISAPDLLILDEPTAGVDIGGQAALYGLIQSLRDELACGILLVSHDLHIVMAATDRVVCLNHHLCCSGTPEVVSQAPEFVSLFGEKLAKELTVYHHQHDHEHDLHGEVQGHDHHRIRPHG